MTKLETSAQDPKAIERPAPVAPVTRDEFEALKRRLARSENHAVWLCIVAVLFATYLVVAEHNGWILR